MLVQIYEKTMKFIRERRQSTFVFFNGNCPLKRSGGGGGGGGGGG